MNLDYRQYYSEEDKNEYIEFFLFLSDVSDFFELAVKNIKRSKVLPGFRKGKIPDKIVMSNFYDEVYSLSLDLAIKSYIKKIFDLLDPKPLSPLTVSSIDRVDDKLKIVAYYLPSPKIEIPDLSNLEINLKRNKMFNEEDVYKELANFWFYYASKNDKNVRKEDFNEDLLNEDFFNKSGIKLDYPMVSSKEDLKNLIKQYLESYYKNLAEIEKEKAIKTKLIDSCKFLKLEGLIIRELNNKKQNYFENLRKSGINVNSYLSSINKTIEELENEWKKELEENLKFELILQEYARLNQIYPSKEEIDEELIKLNLNNNLISKNLYNLNYMRNSVIYYKTNQKAYNDICSKITIKYEDEN